MNNVLEFRSERQNQINWFTLSAVIIFHLVAILSIFTFSWQNLAAAAVVWWISGSLGIGLGYHRLLTHRGFRTSRWFERFLTVCGTLALQSGPMSWVTTHRLHHAFTDTDKDPHSPEKGFFWAHVGWIFKGPAQWHDDGTYKRYSPDLVKDRFFYYAEKYYWATSIAVAAVLFAIGGWQMVVWGIFLRTVAGWHFTWLVNSATHMWGSRRFETRDTSTNNALVAAVTFGEGWHNNHHAFPRSAKHGLSWFEIDVNYIQIWLLERVGLAKDVYIYEGAREGSGDEKLKKAA